MADKKVEKDILKEMVKVYPTCSEVARHFGVSRQLIWKLCKKYGFQFKASRKKMSVYSIKVKPETKEKCNVLGAKRIRGILEQL